MIVHAANPGEGVTTARCTSMPYTRRGPAVLTLDAAVTVRVRRVPAARS